ncbi:hypothetical protein N9N03_00515 [Chlamydiia bacterium]|nr:hypothetical protein [Chlamydiia bacterium]
MSSVAKDSTTREHLLHSSTDLTRLADEHTGRGMKHVVESLLYDKQSRLHIRQITDDVDTIPLDWIDITHTMFFDVTCKSFKTLLGIKFGTSFYNQSLNSYINRIVQDLFTREAPLTKELPNDIDSGWLSKIYKWADKHIIGVDYHKLRRIEIGIFTVDWCRQMHRKLCERVDNIDLLVNNEVDVHSHVSYHQILEALNTTEDIACAIKRAFHLVNRIQHEIDQLDIHGSDDRKYWFKHMLEMQSWVLILAYQFRRVSKETINQICNPEDSSPYLLKTLHRIKKAGNNGKYMFSDLYKPDNGCKFWVFKPYPEATETNRRPLILVTGVQLPDSWKTIFDPTSYATLHAAVSGDGPVDFFKNDQSIKKIAAEIKKKYCLHQNDDIIEITGHSLGSCAAKALSDALKELDIRSHVTAINGPGNIMDVEDMDCLNHVQDRICGFFYRNHPYIDAEGSVEFAYHGLPLIAQRHYRLILKPDTDSIGLAKRIHWNVFSQVFAPFFDLVRLISSRTLTTV